MERDVNAQVRTTQGRDAPDVIAWPNQPLPAPRVAVVATRLDPEREVILPADPHALIKFSKLERTSYQPSGETYLRLAEVNLDDPEAILAFANRYGTLGGWEAYADLVLSGRGSLVPKRLYEGELDFDAGWKAKSRALRSLMEEPEWLRQPTNQADIDKLEEWWDIVKMNLQNPGPPLVETVAEFTFAARCIRDLVTAWRVIHEGLEAEDVGWVSVRPDNLELMDTGTAEHLFASMLNAFLRDFSPQITLRWRYGPGVDPQPPAGQPRLRALRGPEEAPLYAVCALELFNHIIEGAEYRTCANERCSRTFVRQQGRSKKGQHRSQGVRYCSPSCARATAQRDYRRRRKLKRPG
jgi:hypothetical protein